MVVLELIKELITSFLEFFIVLISKRLNEKQKT